MIYEARPNVTFDVFSLCFKSGNACVLKGGKDANYSNTASIELIHKVLITLVSIQSWQPFFLLPMRQQARCPMP